MGDHFWVGRYSPENHSRIVGDFPLHRTRYRAEYSDGRQRAGCLDRRPHVSDTWGLRSGPFSGAAPFYWPGRSARATRFSGPAQPLRLKAAHLAGRSGRAADRPSPTTQRGVGSRHSSSRSFTSSVTGQPPEHRSAQQTAAGSREIAAAADSRNPASAYRCPLHPASRPFLPVGLHKMLNSNR
jgi:hypothetical protein